MVESEIRQRRPIIRESSVIGEVESIVEAGDTENKRADDDNSVQTTIRRHLNSLRRSFAVSLPKPNRIKAVTNSGAQRATVRCQR